MYTLHWIGSMWTILRRTIHLNGPICTTSRCNFYNLFFWHRLSSLNFQFPSLLFAFAQSSFAFQFFSVQTKWFKQRQSENIKTYEKSLTSRMQLLLQVPALKHPTDLCNNLPLLGLLPSYLFICFFAFLSLNIKRLMRFLTPRGIENRQIYFVSGPESSRQL